jgi:hypothetical protein
LPDTSRTKTSCPNASSGAAISPASISATTPSANAPDRTVVLRSANGVRPLLTRADQLRLALDPDATIELNGLVLAGGPLVIEQAADAEARNLVLRHCTLVPGWSLDTDSYPESETEPSVELTDTGARLRVERVERRRIRRLRLTPPQRAEEGGAQSALTAWLPLAGLFLSLTSSA